MKVLMVCLGNICRSPLAEGILQHLIDKEGLDWEVDSAGTSNWHAGDRPDSRSIAEAAKHSIDISRQRSRHFKAKDFADFDLIYVMDSHNYNDVIALAPDQSSMDKVELILNEIHPGRNEQVPDPYYIDGFDKVYAMLYTACEKVVAKYSPVHS